MPGPAWPTRRARGAGAALYLNSLPPCNDACPAGENIQGWLYEAEEGQYQRAWQPLVADNPFPAIMGRVCYHPARPPATVHNWINRWASTPSNGSWATWHCRRAGNCRVEAVDSGKRVLVVGAGPSGLSAAYHLRRAGHHVVIHDAGPKSGGMMRFGIPSYRLPRATFSTRRSSASSTPEWNCISIRR